MSNILSPDANQIVARASGVPTERYTQFLLFLPTRRPDGTTP